MQIVHARIARRITQQAEIDREITQVISHAIMDAAPKGRSSVCIPFEHVPPLERENIKKMLRAQGYTPQEVRTGRSATAIDLNISW